MPLYILIFGEQKINSLSVFAFNFIARLNKVSF